MDQNTRWRSKLFYFFVLTGLISALIIGSVGLGITLGNQQKLTENIVKGEQSPVGALDPQGNPGTTAQAITKLKAEINDLKTRLANKVDKPSSPDEGS